MQNLPWALLVQDEALDLILDIFVKFSHMIVHKLSKYFKLVEITMVQVINYIKNERCFINPNLIKSKL